MDGLMREWKGWLWELQGVNTGCVLCQERIAISDKLLIGRHIRPTETLMQLSIKKIGG
jgi:hypothetical protein